MLGDREDIDEVEDADGVDDQEHEEPDLFAAARRKPERPALPNERPNDGDREQRAESGSSKGRVHEEWRVVVEVHRFIC